MNMGIGKQRKKSEIRIKKEILLAMRVFSSSMSNVVLFSANIPINVNT